MSTPDQVDITSELDSLDDGRYDETRYWRVPDPAELTIGVVSTQPALRVYQESPPKPSTVTVEELPDVAAEIQYGNSSTSVTSVIHDIKSIKVDSEDNIAVGEIEFDKFRTVKPANWQAETRVNWSDLEDDASPVNHVYDECDYGYEREASEHDDTRDMLDAVASEVQGLHRILSKVLTNQQRIMQDQRVIMDRLCDLCDRSLMS